MSAHGVLAYGYSTGIAFATGIIAPACVSGSTPHERSLPRCAVGVGKAGAGLCSESPTFCQ